MTIGSSHNSNSQSSSSDSQDADRTIPALPQLPFKFDTGIALFAKRAPRPFPPPFLSPPSGSFSDPLSTHDRSHNRRPKVNGERIKGWTNGDDAAFASEYFIGTNDGVGAWSARPRGHAGYVPLWLGSHPSKDIEVQSETRQKEERDKWIMGGHMLMVTIITVSGHV